MKRIADVVIKSVALVTILYLLVLPIVVFTDKTHENGMADDGAIGVVYRNIDEGGAVSKENKEITTDDLVTRSACTRCSFSFPAYSAICS